MSEDQILCIQAPSFKLINKKRFYYLYKYNGVLYDEPFQIGMIFTNPEAASRFQGGKLSIEVQYHGTGLEGGKHKTFSKDMPVIEPGKSEEVIFRISKAHVSGNAFLANIQVTSNGKAIPVYAQGDKDKEVFNKDRGFYFQIESPEEVSERYRSRLILIIGVLTFIVVLITLIVIILLDLY